MDFYNFGPIAAVLDAARGLVTIMGSAMEPFFPIASSAAAIVLITLLLRFALIPVGVSQAKAEATRRRLAPALQALRTKWASKPERFATEMQALYAREKTSPFAGFLPILIQIPIVSTIYALFILPTINGSPNTLLTDTAFGVPLGTRLSDIVVGGSVDWNSLAVFGALLLIIAATATLSRRFLAPVPLEQPVPPQRAGATGASAVQMPDLSGLTRVLSYLPYLTVVFAAFVPLAATLYLAVTTVWSLCERLILRRKYNPPAASVTAATSPVGPVAPAA